MTDTAKDLLEDKPKPNPTIVDWVLVALPPLLTAIFCIALLVSGQRDPESAGGKLWSGIALYSGFSAFVITTLVLGAEFFRKKPRKRLSTGARLLAMPGFLPVIIIYILLFSWEDPRWML